MISANGGLPAHRYTPQVTPRWPRGSEPASVEPRDCEVGWDKVMKVWGNGEEEIVATIFELLFNAGRSEDQASDPDLPRLWQSKSSLGSGVGGPLFKKFHPCSPKVSLWLGTSNQ